MKSHGVNMESLGRQDRSLSLQDEDMCLSVKDLDLFYEGGKQALYNISLEIPRKRVTAFIGPSGCGKSNRSIPE